MGAKKAIEFSISGRISSHWTSSDVDVALKAKLFYAVDILFPMKHVTGQGLLLPPSKLTKNLEQAYWSLPEDRHFVAPITIHMGLTYSMAGTKMHLHDACSIRAIELLKSSLSI